VNNNILVTGSSGFIGKYAIPHLKEKFSIEKVSLRSLSVSELKLNKVGTILHLAGKAHQMKEIDPNEYFKVNHQLTIELAKKAKKVGVSHFVFISTVKVFGDKVNIILDEDSICHPTDPYGKSKLIAEQDLLKLASKDFIVSIIRPPLVYGPMVKGNLRKLENLIRKLPILPFKNIKNERSMVFVGNLTALIIHILKSKPQGIFIAGDRERKSTSLLIETMMKHMNLQKKNIGLPKIIWGIIKIVKPNIYTRLLDSYIIDNSKTNRKLSFNPPYSFEEGIKKMILN